MKREYAPGSGRETGGLLRAVARGVVVWLALAALGGAYALIPSRAASSEPLSGGTYAYVRVATGVAAGVSAVASLGARDGVSYLAIGFADRLELGYIGAESRWTPAARFSVAAGVTALAAGSLDPSGPPDVVIGTGGAGSLTVVRSAAPDGTPVAVPVSGYLFGAARRIWIAELDGAPPAEIVAQNVNGGLFVFSAAAGGGYRRLWSTSPGIRIEAAAAGDLDADGVEELLLGRGDGALVLARWVNGRLMDGPSAYPWGTATAMAFVPAPPGSDSPPGVAVITDQKMFYRYVLSDGQLRAQESLYHPSLQVDSVEVQWMQAPAGSRSGALQVMGTGTGGFQAYRLQDGALSALASVGWIAPSRGFVSLGQAVGVIRADGSLDVLQRQPGNYLRIELDGVAVPAPGEIRWEAGRPLVDVNALEHLAGIGVTVSSDGRSAVLRWGGALTTVYADQAVAEGEHLSAPLPAPPRGADGRLYVPFEVLQGFGWSVSFDVARRRLSIRSLSFEAAS